MYSNVPVPETKQILESMLTANSLDPQTTTELLHWYEVITKQNYFVFDDKVFFQTDDLAMGAPSSSVISEIFLQYIEHTHLPLLAHKHRLVNYFPYVDDVLIIRLATHQYTHLAERL
jgi:hypothetical protein